MTLIPLYDPKSGPMPVIGMMSGSGSNLRKIIEHEKVLGRRLGEPPYEIVAIFTNRPESEGSRAKQIGQVHDLPVIEHDIGAFYAARGKPVKDLSLRAEYDTEVLDLIRSQGAKVAAYAGYMSIASEVLTSAMLGVNVHPADLTIMDIGVRRYRGDRAVELALAAHEKQLRSSTHILEPEVDGGRILMISRAIDVKLPDSFNPQDRALLKQYASEHQERLKEAGDWQIFPKTLEYIAQGRYAKDETGLLHFDGAPIPYGWRIDDER